MRYGDPSDQCKNLYRFIRLVLGEAISDREIARRWGIDEKNLRELKQGMRVVPKLSRLLDLAEALGVHKYYVLEVASGVSAEAVHRILRNRSLETDFHEIETALLGDSKRVREQERIHAALHSAALVAQQTVEPEDILYQVSRELKKHAFESHVFSFDPGKGIAAIQHTSFSPRLLKVAESVSGLSLSSFQFPVTRVPVFQSVLEKQRPLFLPDASVLLCQILGERKLKKFTDRMKKIFRILEVIVAPITIRGEVKGVFATGRGGKLNEADVPEINFFAAHLSSSLENAILFQDVKNSECRLKDLLGKLPEGIFACDGAGRILEMNEAAAGMLGFKNQEMSIGSSIEPFRLLNPDARAVRKEIKTSKKITVQNVCGVAQRKDGSPFLTDITLRIERDSRGNLVGAEGVFRDMSQ